jgi:hypothetical protein
LWVFFISPCVLYVSPISLLNFITPIMLGKDHK